MANFFQPTDPKGTESTNSTPSPAAQAMQKWRAEILSRILNYQSSRGPSFKQFTQGTPLRPQLPKGVESGIGELLMAMSQPGAFTSNRTTTGSVHPGAPSMFSDLAQLGILGAQIANSGVVGKILQMIGGAKGIGGINTALGDYTSGDADLDALINSQYGGGSDPLAMIPGGDATNLPADYPGLNDGNGNWFWNLFG